MEQRNTGSNMPSEKSMPDQSTSTTEQRLAATSPNVEAEKQSFTSPNVVQEVPLSESRQAYGTAKTENLQDSGLWRIVLPAFVILCCLAMLAIPLIILIPLLSHSLITNQASLIWLWIVLIILDVGIAAIAIRGLLKIFMTQAGNYQS